jgi:hypothetical protein
MGNLDSAMAGETVADWIQPDVASAEFRSVATLLQRLHHRRPRDLHLERRSLPGGLESHSVARVAARYTDLGGQRRVFTLITKHLHGVPTREALVYEHLLAGSTAELAPRLLATRRPGPGRAVLYLEAARRTSAWPWKELRAVQSVLDRAARLYASVPNHDTVASSAEWECPGDS